MRILLVFGFLVALIAYSLAQDDVSIDCAAFQKQPDGTYRVVAPTIAKIRSSTIILSLPVTAPLGVKTGLSSSVIAPGTKIGNAEVYEALDSQCGGTHG